MPDFPETAHSLIVCIRDPSNRAAWDRFEQLYRPVIFRIARAKGLQHADALDLVQQVMISVASAIDRFEPRNGSESFRHWLSRITRHAIIKALTRQPKDAATGGSVILDVLSAVPACDPETDALIHLEYRRELFGRAATSVRAEVQEATWLAFEMTSLQHMSIEQAADKLGVTVGSIYAARSRVMRRMRDAVLRIEQSNEVEDNKHEFT